METEIDRLKIFVSGNQRELEKEKKTILDLVQNMGFTPASPEVHLGSDLQSIYRKEVYDSDIFIGIFGESESNAALQELDKAREYHKPILIFVKMSKDQREKTTQEFIDRLYNGAIGLSYKKFTDDVDLRNKARDSIIETITERFRKFQGEM